MFSADNGQLSSWSDCAPFCPFDSFISCWGDWEWNSLRSFRLPWMAVWQRDARTPYCCLPAKKVSSLSQECGKGYKHTLCQCFADDLGYLSPSVLTIQLLGYAPPIPGVSGALQLTLDNLDDRGSWGLLRVHEGGTVQHSSRPGMLLLQPRRWVT